jgi:hypothetical protein
VAAIMYSLIKSAHNVGEIYVFSARVFALICCRSCVVGCFTSIVVAATLTAMEDPEENRELAVWQKAL